ncbi:MAG: response regulator transcription factor [Chloroflexi bacterium]|nr:response regulator transcription factor [Chloroflexota bacterium]
MESPELITVLLVDDHQIMLDGVKALLEGSGAFQVVGQALDHDTAMALASENAPQVIVIDVLMHDMGGLQTCADLVDANPDSNLLVLTTATEEDIAVEAIACGANGYMQKYAGAADLMEAARLVAEGRYRISDETLSMVFRRLRRSRRQTEAVQQARLTEREQQMLALYALGQSYAEIANTRGLSPHTVRNAIYAIQSKLGTRTKAELLMWAAKHEIIDTAGPASS